MPVKRLYVLEAIVSLLVLAVTVKAQHQGDVWVGRTDDGKVEDKSQRICPRG